MTSLGELVFKIRAKNAGPFWITIDIFCEKPSIYEKVKGTLNLKAVSKYLRMPQKDIKMFEIKNLRVIKISICRTHVQGSLFDRDIHGAQIANLFSEFQIT